MSAWRLSARPRELLKDIDARPISRAPDEVLDHPKTPVRELLEVAYGLAGVDLSTVLALNVPKPERLVSEPSDQPTTRHPTSGISRRNAPAALREMKAGFSTDNASVRRAGYEHRDPVEVPHAISMVGLTRELSCKGII